MTTDVWVLVGLLAALFLTVGFLLWESVDEFHVVDSPDDHFFEATVRYFDQDPS